MRAWSDSAVEPMLQRRRTLRNLILEVKLQNELGEGPCIQRLRFCGLATSNVPSMRQVRRKPQVMPHQGALNRDFRFRAILATFTNSPYSHRLAPNIQGSLAIVLGALEVFAQNDSLGNFLHRLPLLPAVLL